jgi:Autographiviridae endonuclease VII
VLEHSRGVADPVEGTDMGERTCSVDGCNRTPKCKTGDLCGAHLHRLNRYGSPTGLPPRTVPPEATERQCTRCATLKPLDQFGPLKTGQHGRKPNCRECEATKARSDMKRRWADDPSHMRLLRGRHAVKAAYGEAGVFQLARIERGEGCDVCGATASSAGRRLHIDHDHASGFVRGILCHACNTALGLAKDSPERLRDLADYLEAFDGFGARAEGAPSATSA